MELDGLPSTVMPPPTVTLIFDLLIRKPNQYVSNERIEKNPTCFLDSKGNKGVNSEHRWNETTREMLEFVKKRKLAYYGHIVRKQGIAWNKKLYKEQCLVDAGDQDYERLG